MELSRAFLQAASGAAASPPAIPPDLEVRLRAAHAAGGDVWPGVTVAARDFAAYLGERLRGRPDLAAAIDRLHTDDLYLACACGAGDPAAVAALERHFIEPAAAFFLARTRSSQAAAELGQSLRTRLLVAEPGQRPRIASYSGEGPLGGWLRTVASRLVVDLHRDRDAGLAYDDAMKLSAGAPDPEVDYLKLRYGAEFRAAFVDALAALPARDGTLLRLHFLEGLSADQIGTMYRVTKRSIQRWIQTARDQVLTDTRRLLTQRLRVSPTTLETLMRLAQSQVDADIVDLLGGKAAGPG